MHLTERVGDCYLSQYGKRLTLRYITQISVPETMLLTPEECITIWYKSASGNMRRVSLENWRKFSDRGIYLGNKK